MNFFVSLLFLIPLSFAGTAPDCQGLGKILEDYEKDLQKKSIVQCEKLNHIDLLGSMPVKDADFLKGKLCLELGNIETQVEKLKAELAVLTGIDKLKTAVSKSKEKAEDGSRVAGLSFLSSLNAAQSLEVLLGTVLKDGKMLIEKIKELPPEKRLTQKDLVSQVQNFCKEEDKNQVNACNPKVFNPDQDASRELLDLIKNSTVDKSQISKWQKMLAIKRKNVSEEDSSYSFHQMQTELASAFRTLDRKEIMSKNHLKAIAKLDDFENAQGLSFVEDIASIKDKKKTKILSDKLFVLMGDAKLRQQYEVQSKLSVLLENYGSEFKLSPSEKSTCDEAKIIYEKAKACHGFLEREQKSLSQENIKTHLSSLRASVDYIDSLEEMEGQCREDLKSTGILPPNCYEHFEKDMAEVQDKILQLNILKERIGSENQDLMTYRNFALKKWGEMCQKADSPMDFCESPDTPGTISKESFLTISDIMKISIATPKITEDDEKIKVLCDDTDKKKRAQYEEKLCAFFDDMTSDIIMTKNESHPDGPVKAPDGKHKEAALRDAWIGGTALVVSEGLKYFMPRTSPTNMPAMNPYQYNFSGYGRPAATMGVADTILFNARYHGAYGYYMSTPGAQPYTAFGNSTMISPYRSASVGTSTYFGR
jgi:hypothetical protein